MALMQAKHEAEPHQAVINLEVQKWHRAEADAARLARCFAVRVPLLLRSFTTKSGAASLAYGA